MMQSDAVSLAVAKTSMQTGEIVLNPVPKQTTPIDATAWVDDHGDFLYRYAVVRLRDDSIAEDVVQETLLAAIQSITSYSGKATERTWLTSILKHKIIDHFRKSVREVPIDESDTDMSGFDKFFERDDEWTGHWSNDLQPYDWNMSPEAALQENEFFKVLQNCMSKLPARVAGVFALREMDGLDSSEICEALCLTASNFWVMMHRARMSLRRCMESNWFKKI